MCPESGLSVELWDRAAGSRLDGFVVRAPASFCFRARGDRRIREESGLKTQCAGVNSVDDKNTD